MSLGTVEPMPSHLPSNNTSMNSVSFAKIGP